MLKSEILVYSLHDDQKKELAIHGWEGGIVVKISGGPFGKLSAGWEQARQPEDKTRYVNALKQKRKKPSKQHQTKKTTYNKTYNKTNSWSNAHEIHYIEG